MKLGIGNYLSIVAILGMSLPVSAFEVPATPSPSPKITDVSLSSDGDFLGAVVQRDGRPLAGQMVQVLAKETVIATAKTDADGRYRIKGLRSGIHQVKALNQQQVCRIWEQSDAPPAAKKGLITAQENTVARGQTGGVLEIGAPELIGLGIFGATTAVTLASTLGNNNSNISGSVPASP